MEESEIVKKRSRGEIDMLHGPIWSRLIWFVMPLAATGILQQLFNAADVAVVGRFAGKEAMAAVGNCSSLVGLVVQLMTGFSVGANVVISRYIGQQREADVKKAVHTAVPIAIIGGLALTVIGELLSRPILEIMGVPSDVMQLALDYIRWYFAGLAFVFLYNVLAAIFRSIGDTTTPLYCLVAAGCINVSLNIFFVRALNMSASGVAIATVISNMFSMVVLLIVLIKRESIVRLEPKDIKIYRHELKSMLCIGAPAGIQGMVFSFSNICVQTAINSLGSDVMAASAAAFNLEIMIYFVMNAFGQGCTTFIGQNYGAGNIERCRRITLVGWAMNGIVTMGLATIMVIFGRPLLSIFNSNPEIIEIGMIRVVAICGPELLNMTIDTLSGCMRGYGYSLQPAITALVGICGVRILWVFTVFKASPSFMILMMVYPVSWAITLVGIIFMYLSVRKKTSTV